MISSVTLVQNVSFVDPVYSSLLGSPNRIFLYHKIQRNFRAFGFDYFYLTENEYNHRLQILPEKREGV